MALYLDATGQLVIASSLPPGGSAVSGAASGSLADLAAWLRGLDGAAAWHPASYYAGGGEDASAVSWSDVTGSGKPADNATKNTIFRQSTAPTSGMTTNDIWFDTSTLNPKVYSYNGSSWVLAGDITGNNTAAAISGQGALATVNQINSGNFSTLLGNQIIDGDRLIVGALAKLTRYFTATSWSLASGVLDSLYVSGFTTRNAVGRRVVMRVSVFAELTTDTTRDFRLFCGAILSGNSEIIYQSSSNLGAKLVAGTCVYSGDVYASPFSVGVTWQHAAGSTQSISNLLFFVEELTA
ncbi:hypothetical protein HC024_00125 [Methylococcaceae bacterium WWC4]|nr:hypothetical protein [Methylococcaceae bacterium WWC4]